VKAGTPVKITVGTNNIYNGQVSLRRANASEVEEQLQRIAADEDRKVKLAADKDAFIEEMAK